MVESTKLTKILVQPKEIVDDRWLSVLQIRQSVFGHYRKSSMVDGLMVIHRIIQQGVHVVQKMRMMVDEGKRVMMCHTTSTSTFCAMLVNLTPQDDVSFHVRNFHIILEVDNY
jgi:hypothetical protein